MKRIVFFVLAMTLFIVAAGAVASAQQTRIDTIPSANLARDDRYEGYPRALVEWPTEQPDLVAVVGHEYYEPVDTHLCRYKDRVKVASVRVQEFDEVTWMLTRFRWRWVLRPKGTKVAVDAQGRDLFDMGSPAGQTCCNPRPVAVPVRTVPIVEVPPPPPPKEAPAKPPKVEVPPSVPTEQPRLPALVCADCTARVQSEKKFWVFNAEVRQPTSATKYKFEWRYRPFGTLQPLVLGIEKEIRISKDSFPKDREVTVTFVAQFSTEDGRSCKVSCSVCLPAGPKRRGKTITTITAIGGGVLAGAVLATGGDPPPKGGDGSPAGPGCTPDPIRGGCAPSR